MVNPIQCSCVWCVLPANVNEEFSALMSQQYWVKERSRSKKTTTCPDVKEDSLPGAGGDPLPGVCLLLVLQSTCSRVQDESNPPGQLPQVLKLLSLHKLTGEAAVSTTPAIYSRRASSTPSLLQLFYWLKTNLPWMMSDHGNPNSLDDTKKRGE